MPWPWPALNARAFPQRTHPPVAGTEHTRTPPTRAQVDLGHALPIGARMAGGGGRAASAPAASVVPALQPGGGLPTDMHGTCKHIWCVPCCAVARRVPARRTQARRSS
jgi:hypothetical protein